MSDPTTETLAHCYRANRLHWHQYDVCMECKAEADLPSCIRDMCLQLQHSTTLLEQLVKHQILDIHQRPVFWPPSASKLIQRQIELNEEALGTVDDIANTLYQAEQITSHFNPEIPGDRR